MTRALVIFMFVVGSAVAYAQPKAPADDRAKAASHFKQGQLYFQQGDWDRAITEYQQAYALSQEPLLLFNIALCNDRAGRPEKALEGFQRYIDLEPNGDVGDEAREDIVRLTPVVEKIRAEKTQQEQAAAAAKAVEARKAEEARKAQEAELAKQREAKRAEREAEAAPLEKRAKLERWGGIGAAAVGTVTILVLGAHYGLVARNDARIINANRDAWTDDLIATDQEGQKASTKMIGYTTVGGALIVGGGVLYVLGMHTHNAAEKLRVGAAPSHGGFTFAVSGAF